MTTTLTPKTFAELFTYSGGTNGSRVNAQGFIESCATPRYDFDPITKAAKGLLIESGRINQLAFSSRFEAAIWTRSAVSTVPGAAVAPNGRWDACKLILDNGTGAGNGHIRQFFAKTAAVITYTFSCYAKPAGSSNGWLYARGASTADFVSIPFNLATLTATGNAGGGFIDVSKRVLDVGNGWRRVEITFTTDASAAITTSIYPGSATGGNGNGVDGLYVWGAQLESGAFASSYIPSLDTVTARASIGSYYDSKGILRYAAAGVARNSYEPSNLPLPPVLMVEEQRVNILLKSSDMHLVPWFFAGAVARATGKLAPDGTLRAVEVSGAPTGSLGQTVAATSTVMTFSVYLKNVSREAPVSLQLRNTTTSAQFTFGYATLHGSTPSISGAGWEMRSVGGGWFRCTFTQATGITVGDTLAIYPFHVGDGTDHGAFQIWGAQLEAGAYATSYIPSNETFTGRASIGTYFDSTGAMKTAAAGVARMTYNPADLTIAPWLVQEGQSTNFLLQSDMASNAAWGGTPSRTLATETFAGLPFWELKKTLTATSEGWSQLNLAPVAAGETFTATCALLAGTSAQVSVGLYDRDGSAWGAVTDRSFEFISGPGTVTTSTGALAYISGLSATVPTVFRVTRKYAAAGTVGFVAYPDTANSTTVGRSVKLARPQVEPGAVATSYIPTTTAAVTRLADTVTSAATTRQADTASSAATTRAGDMLRIDTTKGWFNSADGAVYMDLEVPMSSDIATRTILEFAAGANRMGVSYTASSPSPTSYGYTVMNGTTLTTPGAGALLPGSTVKIAMSYGVDGVRFACNNQPIRKVASAIPAAVTWLGIGNTAAAGGNQPFFHVRAVRYQSQKLTDAEVVALTG